MFILSIYKNFILSYKIINILIYFNVLRLINNLYLNKIIFNKKNLINKIY